MASLSGRNASSGDIPTLSKREEFVDAGANVEWK
jgi:hypothetical protein